MVFVGVLGFGVLLALALTVSMVRGGKLGTRYYLGGQSWTDRDRQGRPVEPTDNERSRRW